MHAVLKKSVSPMMVLLAVEAFEQKIKNQIDEILGEKG